MHVKKLLVGLCAIVLLSSAVPVYATPGDSTSLKETSIVSPQMTYIARASCNVTITSSGQAQVESAITGYSGTVTSVKITADLQQYKNNKWTSVKTWSKTDNNYRLSLAESMKVSKGYSYRVVSTVTAYSGSSSETQTITSSTATY